MHILSNLTCGIRLTAQLYEYTEVCTGCVDVVIERLNGFWTRLVKPLS